MKKKEIDVLQLNKLGYDDKLKDGQIIRDCKYNNYYIYDKYDDIFYHCDYNTKKKDMGMFAYYIKNAKKYKIELIDEEKEKQNESKNNV